MKSFLLASFFILGTVTSIASSLSLKFSARNLPDMDPLGFPPDPKVYIYLADTFLEPFKKIGETEKIQDDHNPDWNTVIEIDYYPSGDQWVKFDVMDADFDSDDYIGYVEVALKELAGTTKTINLSPSGRGSLIITGI